MCIGESDHSLSIRAEANHCMAEVIYGHHLNTRRNIEDSGGIRTRDGNKTTVGGESDLSQRLIFLGNTL